MAQRFTDTCPPLLSRGFSAVLRQAMLVIHAGFSGLMIAFGIVRECAFASIGHTGVFPLRDFLG